MREIPSPEFGDTVVHRATACSPPELYRAMVDLEHHAHYIEPAFLFASTAVEAAADDAGAADDADPVQALLATARRDLTRVPPATYAPSWPVRAAAEFAPSGLSDGAWLHGLTSIAHVETPVGVLALQQLMIRCGDPGTTESYSQRYATLLRSLGIPPGGIGRDDLDEMLPCAAISYEHALLGLTLSLFPSILGPETIGFNLWVSALGPCPLLDRLAPQLRERGADFAYFDAHDRQRMTAAAMAMVERLLASRSDADAAGRVARGFRAAHRSYLRWERAVCGANVPMSPHQCVVDMVRRKARFAAGHHRDVRLDDRPLDAYFDGGPDAHADLVDRLASSPWVHRGSPGTSPLLTEAVAMGGPMFDIFTMAEQRDLGEWIATLPIGAAAVREETPPSVPLEGAYAPPQDAESLAQFAQERFSSVAYPELLFHLINPDRCPAVRLFARAFAEQTLARVTAAFGRDPRLDAAAPPPYGERELVDLMLDYHHRNVASQQRPVSSEPELPGIATLLDGCWLQGFVNVLRAGIEEHGWLFRIYASEMGDGRLEWNHNYIARQMFRDALPEVEYPATDRRLYDAVQVGIIPVAYTALALNTHAFLPELLGLTLAIEARGVCGTYITTSRSHDRSGRSWASLYYRLHNSIDNYATGHTRWSQTAVQAFMTRVNEVAPAAVPTQWTRIWTMWRLLEIQAHGSPEERQALQENLGPLTYEPFVPSAVTTEGDDA